MDILGTYGEWMKRPDDQRFLSVQELYDHVKARRGRSTQEELALDLLRFDGNDRDVLLCDERNGTTVPFTHFSFSQICSSTGLNFSAKELRKLKYPKMAAAVLQRMATLAPRKGVKSLQTGTESGQVVRAVTSATYGRIWDEEIVKAVLDNVDLDRWKVPYASYASQNPKLASTLYASDRDVMLWLVDEENPIEVPRGGGVDTMFRGFLISNSETGNGTAKFLDFLYRSSCDNRLLYGVDINADVRIRHTSGAPHRFRAELEPAMVQAQTADPRGVVKVIQAAQDYVVAKTDKATDEWLSTQVGFNSSLAREVRLKAEEEGESNPRSLWGLVQGATALARSHTHQDTRVAAEANAAKLMKKAEARVS